MVEEFYQCKPSCQGAVGYGCVCDCCGQTHGVATVAYVLGLSSAAMVRISEEVNTARFHRRLLLTQRKTSLGMWSRFSD